MRLILSVMLGATTGCQGAPGSTDTADTASGSTHPVDGLAYHDGYWVTTFQIPGTSFEGTTINDMHINLETRQATVYAQVRVANNVLSPPQVGPGECTTLEGDTVCFHPNAVYLNGSGQELEADDGSGAWWIKHAWVVDGEGYDNCEPIPLLEVYDCLPTIGELLEDGVTLSMQVGTWGEPGSFNNLRRPLLDQTPITYEVANYTPTNTDPAQGEVDLTRRFNGASIFECTQEVSAFDNLTRPCPEAP